MEMSTDDIRALALRSGQGDKESFERIYEHMASRVYAYLRSRTGTKEQATDLAQDVFVELWKALPRFTYHSREQFYAYVFIITKRQLFAKYKHQERESVLLDEESASDEGNADDREQHDVITRALSTLDEETREILVLHHWSRYTFGEIAVLIGKTESAVRVQHHRALKLLRTTLSKENYA